MELAGEPHTLEQVPPVRLFSQNRACMRAVELTTMVLWLSSSVVCLAFSVVFLSQESIFLYSRGNESLNERIIEHILHISRSGAVVEKAILVPYCALVHLAQLFARHKRSIFVFEGLPVSC